MTSSDNLWEDTDDKGVEEGGGNRSEQQHVSHQVPSGGRPRHRTGHTYAPASSPLSPSSYSSLTSPPSCPIIFTNLLPLKPSWNYNNQQNVFHAWLQYIKDFWKISNHSETLQKLLKRFRNKLWTPVLKCDQQWLTTVKPHGRAAHESPPVISFWTANKLITGSSSSHPIVSPTSLLVTPWTRRPTERLEGVVVDAGGEFLPTRSRIVSSSDKSEF